MAVYDEWEAANAKVAGLSLDALTHAELLGFGWVADDETNIDQRAFACGPDDRFDRR